ncbi:MAG: hypothetical protein K6E51_00840 [Treponema sp.]|nr:hypothetical protein [Treponema sp.]
MNYIDPTGMEAEPRSTSDRLEIVKFYNYLCNGGSVKDYDFSNWYNLGDGDWEGCVDFWLAANCGDVPIYGGYTPDGNHILWGNKEYGANMLYSRSWFTFCNFINGLTYSLQPAYSQFTPESDYSLGLIDAFGENANDIRLGCNDKFYFRNYTVGRNKYGMPKIIGDKKFVSNLNSRFLTRASSAVTAYSLYVGAKNSFNAYKHGGPNALYNATMQGGKCVGNVVGAMAGAQIGQYVGGVIGACFGGAGAVPGAIIGNVVGGWVGGMAGEWAGETIINGIFN